MNARTAALLLGPVLAFGGACTVLNDMDSYTGGAADTGVTPPIDSGLDTGAAIDSATPPVDSGVDSAADTLDDSEPVDSGVDSAPDTTPDTGVTDTSDGATCGATYRSFGLSEVMVRGTSGIGDKREWIELTNYGTAPLDISGVTVRVVGASSGENALFVFPAGTAVAGGSSVIIVGNKTAFLADLTTTINAAAVFEFGKSDWLVNSSSNEVQLSAPGCSGSFYETAVIPSRSWDIGQPYAFPIPSSTCPASGRLTSTGALGTHWKEVTSGTYGAYVLSDAGMQPLYGTPTKPNTGVACP